MLFVFLLYLGSISAQQGHGPENANPEGGGALRVRNYRPVETVTPGLQTPVLAPTASLPAATRTPVMTPTSLPPNPALVTEQDLQASMMRGVGITLALFGVFGLYLALKILVKRIG